MNVETRFLVGCKVILYRIGYSKTNIKKRINPPYVTFKFLFTLRYVFTLLLYVIKWFGTVYAFLLIALQFLKRKLP